MNRILNIIRQILLLILASLYLILTLAFSTNIYSFILQIVFFLIFTITTAIDLFRKRTVSFKRNLWQILFIVILLFFLLRPFIDRLMIPYLNVSPVVALGYTSSIFENNQMLISVMMVLFLINNYVEYKVK